MSRPVKRQRPQADRRAPAGQRPEQQTNESGPRSPESVLLRLQTQIGNAAATRVLARGPQPAPAEPPITRTGWEGAGDWDERGRAHFKAGRYEKALKAFEEAHRLAPKANGFLYLQGQCLEQLGRKKEAADKYERYLAEMPSGVYDNNTPNIRERIRKLRGEAEPAGGDPASKGWLEGARQWFDRGQLAYLAGDYAKALESYKNAHRLYPMPDFVFNQGACLQMLGRPAAAANAFEHYLVLAPGAKDALQTVERIKKLRAEAARDPIVDPWADESAAPAVTAAGLKGAGEWYDRGAVAYRLGDYKRAHEAFVHAYELKAQPDLVYNQAAALDQLGSYDAAVYAYKRYLALVPDAADADKVRKRIEKLSGASPKQEAGEWHEKGAAAYHAGKFTHAYAYFTRAYELRPLPDFVYNQAASLDRLGSVEAAIHAYERYLVLAPKAADAGKVRKRIAKLREGKTKKP